MRKAVEHGIRLSRLGRASAALEIAGEALAHAASALEEVGRADGHQHPAASGLNVLLSTLGVVYEAVGKVTEPPTWCDQLKGWRRPDGTPVDPAVVYRFFNP